MECGQEILNKSGYCPVCGAAVRHSFFPNAIVKAPSRTVGADEKKESYNEARQKDTSHGKKAKVELHLLSQETQYKQKNILFCSCVGLFITGIMQFALFNPLLKSGFSIWNYYAYMRGVPLFICIILPYGMIACEVLVITAGILGLCFAGWRGAARFYKMSGVVTAVVASVLLVIRIVYAHIVFMSVGGGNQKDVIPETVFMFQKQYLQSLYPIFIFAAISTAISFFYLYGSAQFCKPSRFNKGKALIVTGSSGFIGSIYGIIFGRYAAERIPAIAVWAAIAFGYMLVVGIAGASKRRKPSARAILGLSQIIIFTFCMLQTIYYAYAAVINGEFFYNVPFVWITVLSGSLAVSTIVSALYVSDALIANTPSKK